MANEKYVKKIKLSDGSEYYVHDVNAPRKADLDNYLPKSGGSITGDMNVDNMLRTKQLNITSIEYQDTTSDNILIQAPDGTIKKQTIDKLLGDISGCSYSINNATGVLSFKKILGYKGSCTYEMDNSSNVLSFTTR